MRCVIARFPFELTKSGVLESMKGIKPEAGTGESVTIGRRRYPAKQVGQVITGQDRRDFTAGEVVRAMTRLGFTCHTLSEAAPVPVLSPLQRASAMLGTPLPA
ncbi:SCO5918 family protein [Streptomyces chrestomyceticus]|uniref:SCO5918 family protein n=1 Tax=Streptomyces chrestomyceticus TaxID=68185 RepID=UPI0035A81826